MDGRQFDSLTRAIAGRLDRRAFLWRSAAVTGVVGSMAAVDSASAARRGDTGAQTSICAPNGSGGYYRTQVPSLLLQTYLNSGYIISSCCANADCGGSGACSTGYCDLNAGACAVSYADGASCDRPGCVPGTCSGGVCTDPTRVCGGDGFCNTCTFDACLNRCNCRVKPCYVDDYQCQDAYCDPAQQACVLDAINEGSTCDTHGEQGTCVMGYCTSA